MAHYYFDNIILFAMLGVGFVCFVAVWAIIGIALCLRTAYMKHHTSENHETLVVAWDDDDPYPLVGYDDEGSLIRPLGNDDCVKMPCAHKVPFSEFNITKYHK